jgi:hypothetical protein
MQGNSPYLPNPCLLTSFRINHSVPGNSGFTYPQQKGDFPEQDRKPDHLQGLCMVPSSGFNPPQPHHVGYPDVYAQITEASSIHPFLHGRSPRRYAPRDDILMKWENMTPYSIPHYPTPSSAWQSIPADYPRRHTTQSGALEPANL